MRLTIDGSPIRYELLPANLRGGVERWIEKGVMPGDFLTAVIHNDLFEAFSRADIHSRMAMFDIIVWFYNHAPRSCYGSKEEVQQWKAGRDAERAKQKEAVPCPR